MTRLRSATDSGFTLVELIVTIAVLAVLVAMAGPAIDRLARQSRLDADTEKFQAALSYARSEAMKRSTTVSILPSASGYAGGWRITTDNGTLNPDCRLDTERGEAILRVQDPLSASTGVILASEPASSTTQITCATPSLAPNACISYRYDGASILTNGGFLATTVCVRDQADPTGLFRAFTINSTGQPYLSKVKN